MKEGGPEYEITLAKIKGYTAWQESAGVKVRTTTNTAAVRTLLSIKKIGEDTNKRVAGMEPKIEALHADMQQRHTDQLKVEEKKLEVAQAKAKAKADGNEAFAKRIEAGNGTPLEEKQLKLKILAEEIRQQKAELELEKARKPPFVLPLSSFCPPFVLLLSSYCPPIVLLLSSFCPPFVLLLSPFCPPFVLPLSSFCSGL